MGRGYAPYAGRLSAVRFGFGLGLALTTLRLFSVQVLSHGTYDLLASGQHDLLAKLLPERGEIYAYDALSPTGRVPVAVNRSLHLVYAVPKEVADPAAFAQALAPLLGLDPAVLELVLAKQDDPYEPLAHEVTDEVAGSVAALQLPGIRVVPETIRAYPAGDSLGAVTGFVGYVGDRRRGQYGLEQYWDSTLAGTQGSIRSERDAAGSLIALGENDVVPAVNGADLYLTIDASVQQKACAALREAVVKHGAAGGSTIVMDPSTGAVRALCNSPSFDPNHYREVTDQTSFIDSVSSVTYEPGSVFKPITMAGAIEAGVVSPETTYTDTGEVAIGPHTIRNSDLKAHGLQTMTQVLESSLNTGAIYAMRQLGAAKFVGAVKAFGFGQRTGVELPHEQPGSIRSLSSKNEIYPATASFGQGITVTPLQMVAAFGALAHGGRLMQPYLVDEVRYPDGRVEQTKPTVVRQVVSPRTAAVLSAMLVSVVEKGHGKRAGVPGYYVAGKTGTAQVSLPNGQGYDPQRSIGTFVGFAPVDNPRFVMLVKISDPRDVVFAESSAAPVFGEVAKFLLDYYQVPPQRDVTRTP